MFKKINEKPDHGTIIATIIYVDIVEQYRNHFIFIFF